MIVLLAFFLSFTAFAQQQVEHIDPGLIGGEVANPTDWQASPWIGNCSSTLISEKVLITAAHCVRNNGSVGFTINNTRYSGTCSHHPQYSRNNTADWALCLLTTPVVGIEFENVAKAEEVTCERGKEFTWTGYGCTRWGGRIDGKFRTGKSPAIRCPSGTNYDTVTKGTVALCSGDSGGGGYLEIAGLRKVVGVNSRSNTVDTSYVSSTYSQAFQTWIKEWSVSKSVKICGLDVDAVHCKGAEPKPGCEPEEQLVEEVKQDLRDAEALLEACRHGG